MKTILFFTTLVTATLAGAKPKPLAKAEPLVKEKILEKLQDKYRSVESFEADILQEVYQAALARTKTSKGSLALQKPNRIRWEFYSPDASILVSNGLSLWYYTPSLDPKGKGQAIKRSSKELSKQAVYRILTGQAGLKREFKILEHKETSDGGNVFVLSPLTDMGEVKKLRLSLGKGLEITEIFLENKSDNTTRILLQNSKLGGKLPRNLFDFKPPQGTEIIEE